MIGGGVGGAVFLILLIIALRILLWNYHKKKKAKYLNSTVLFMTSQNASVTCNPHYLSESPAIEITEKSTEIQERICK